jgi:dienelactone hydrolase
VTITIEIDGDKGGTCLDFTIHGGPRVIPATFWPASREAGHAETKPPVTLIQHGGPLHKRHERTDWLAQATATWTGGAVLLIDGPIHGLRRTDQPELMQMLGIFKQYWREDGGIDAQVEDWTIALDAVLGQGWADPDRVAWLGVSMGTAYGIPLCAAESRIRAAAMGMWGTDWGQEKRLLNDAQRLRTPTLFQIKQGDEIFTTAGQRALFDALGCPDKCLHTFPGGHGLETPGQLEQILAFITTAFAGDQAHAGPGPGRAIATAPAVAR